MKPPRRRARARDYAWATLAAVGVAGLAAALLLGVRLLLGPAPVPLLLWPAMIALSLYWVAAGAWRRTVWGAPPPSLEWLPPEAEDR